MEIYRETKEYPKTNRTGGDVAEADMDCYNKSRLSTGTANRNQAIRIRNRSRSHVAGQGQDIRENGTTSKYLKMQKDRYIVHFLFLVKKVGTCWQM